MKTADSVKASEFERQAMERLEVVLSRVPFLKVRRIEAAVCIAGMEFDFIAEVAIGKEKPWTLACEVKSNPRPSVARMAIIALHNKLRQCPGRHYGVLITPFVSDRTREICLESDMGFLDFAGNCRLCFNHVFIESTGHKAQAPSPKRLYPTLFATRSTRVLRWVLRHPQEYWKVQDLARETGVSIGLVSNVRRGLLEQGWAVSGTNGLRLAEPNALLDAWREAYSRPVETRNTYYTLLHGRRLDEAVTSALTAAGQGEHAMLAGLSAAQWIAPYARTNHQHFYVDKVGQDVLSERLKLRPADEMTEANVILERPKDDGIFLDRIDPAPSIWCTSPVQTYLDLTHLGERGQEAAKHLRREVLTPEWKK